MNQMWKLTNGQLVQATDTARVELEARISSETLKAIEKIAKDNNSFPNYVIEDGLKNLLAAGEIYYNKKLRPKDRTRYRTTYDEQLIESLRTFAKDNHLYLGDVIETSFRYINIDEVKSKDYRHRIER